jgi:curved DNA-binding protein
MDYKDYYQVLGVSKDAPADEIKKNYRKLARKFHPDVNPDKKGAEEKLKDINEAYQVLSDPEKRKKYDQFGSQWQQYTGAGGRPEDFNWGQWTAQPGRGGSTRTMNAEELEQMFGNMGGFSSFFETLFGSAGGGRTRAGSAGGGMGDLFGTRGQNVSMPSADVEHPLQITLEEAFHGTTRSLQWEDGRKIEPKIPRGVKTGSKVRLSGQVAARGRTGKSGDLYLKIEVLPNSIFEREGNDLRTTIQVDLYTAVLGGSVDVSSIDRTVKLTIPPGTSNGKIFRLTGLGMPLLRSPDQYGDLYAKLDVQFPKNLSAEEMELFKQLQVLRNKKPR